MIKYVLLAAGIAALYVLTKPTVKAGCVTVINPFTGKAMSSCAGTNTGNVAGAALPIRQGATNTDTGGLNSNGGHVQPLNEENVDSWTYGGGA